MPQVAGVLFLQAIHDKRICPRSYPGVAVRFAVAPCEEERIKMSSGFYIRTMVAGRYVKRVRYTRAMPSDNKAVRSAKRSATTAAQKFINIKNTAEKLELYLCANFDSKNACFCTFTFADDNLPANRKHTQAEYKAFLKRLSLEWKHQGRELKYIYTIEGESIIADPEAQRVEGNTWETEPWRVKSKWADLDTRAPQEKQKGAVRLHAHCFLLLKKEDYETVRALWPYGKVYISRMKVNDRATFSKLASYVTKDCRSGQKRNGERAYIPSLNLEKPVVTGHWCSEMEAIAAPPGAEELQSGCERNSVYGSAMEYVYFRMPRKKPEPPQPYKSKGKIYQTMRI